MSRYIDADHLKAKFDEHYRKYQSKYMETRNPYTQGLMDALDLAEQVIDSLQQEQWEVDLEKETIIDYAHNHYHYDKDFDGYGHSNLGPVFTREDLTKLARHFYELGRLNARKEEANERKIRIDWAW